MEPGEQVANLDEYWNLKDELKKWEDSEASLSNDFRMGRKTREDKKKTAGRMIASLKSLMGNIAAAFQQQHVVTVSQKKHVQALGYLAGREDYAWDGVVAISADILPHVRDGIIEEMEDLDLVPA